MFKCDFEEDEYPDDVYRLERELEKRVNGKMRHRVHEKDRS